MQHYYVIDLESFVFSGKYTKLTSAERKKIDDETILRHTELLLNLLSKQKTKLTFFIVGEIFEWYPDLIQDIFDEGHEIAFHTHNHTYLTNSTLLLKELEQSKHFIEKYKIKGFQAPAIIINSDYYKYLKDFGFKYSSSVYSSAKPFQTEEGIVEIPVSTKPIKNIDIPIEYPTAMSFSMLKKEIPFGSSFFLKILGAKRISKYIREVEIKGQRANLFIHNWQLFSEPLKAKIDRLSENVLNPLSIPYNFNVLKEFEFLLQEHQFTRMDYEIKKEN